MASPNPNSSEKSEMNLKLQKVSTNV